jgi:hypothetical protein
VTEEPLAARVDRADLVTSSTVSRTATLTLSWSPGPGRAGVRRERQADAADERLVRSSGPQAGAAQ